MAVNMLDLSWMGNLTDWDKWHMKMGIPIKENSFLDKLMDKVYTNGKMGAIVQENGKTVIWEV